MSSRIGDRAYSCSLVCVEQKDVSSLRDNSTLTKKKRLVPVSKRRMMDRENVLKKRRRFRKIVRKNVVSERKNKPKPLKKKWTPKKSPSKSKPSPTARTTRKEQKSTKKRRVIRPILITDSKSDLQKGRLPSSSGYTSSSDAKSKKTGSLFEQLDGVKHYREAIDRIAAKYSALEKAKKKKTKKRITKEECKPPHMKWVVPKVNKKTGKSARPYCISVRSKPKKPSTSTKKKSQGNKENVKRQISSRSPKK